MAFTKHIFTSLILACFACQGPPEEPLFDLYRADQTGITFKNILQESGEFNVLNYSYFYNGGGVAIGDVNNDNLPDIYLTGNLVASHLYLNQGDWKFKEVAEVAGVRAEGFWNTGVTMADVNEDGWLDIYVCRSAANKPARRQNLLFLNNGGTGETVSFTESSAKVGLNDNGYSTQAAFLDYDRDGDLDMYLLNHSVPEYANFNRNSFVLKNRKGEYYGDKLFRNDQGVFSDISDSAGILQNVLGFGLGISISDFNNDHWPDIYISNDFNEEDYLYINNQDGTFKESLREYFDHVSLFSMGSDAGDLNNDGHADLITLDMLPQDNYRIKLTSGADNYDKYQLLLQQQFHKQSMRNMLHSATGQGRYREVGQLSGISNSDWSWSALIADYDLDGLQDIYVTNGYMRDYTNMDFLAYTVDMKLQGVDIQSQERLEEVLTQMPRINIPNKMYCNQGQLVFQDSSSQWGFGQPLMSNGAAYGDLDADGDLDLVVNNINEYASIYRNQAIETSRGNYLKIRPDSDDGKTNMIGLKVSLHIDDQEVYRHLFPSRGYQSAVEPAFYFGLGQTDKIDSLVAIWPDGMIESFDFVPINTLLILKKGTGTKREMSQPTLDPIFVNKNKISSYRHFENNFNDFHTQSLLPTLYSRSGPPLLALDINQDGIEELIIGGAAGQGTKILRMKGNELSVMENVFAASEAAYEDTDISTVDVNADGYPDLVIASGGNSFTKDDERYLTRLYINNANGTFSKSPTFPKVSSNATKVVSADFDGNGLTDLFIGSAYRAQEYPLPDKNRLLWQTQPGTFSEATDLPFGDYRVTDGTAADIHDDGIVNLVLVGEWEFVQAWSHRKGQWSLMNHSPHKGWYSAVKAIDLDDDSNLEIVVGNYGLNSQLKASAAHPMVLYYGDFDLNETVDPILATPLEGVLYPFVARDDLLAQLPGLKKRFTSYRAYAKTTMSDLLPDLPKYQTDTIHQLASIILDIAEGPILDEVELPSIAQVAPIYAIEHFDVDSDGDQDLILAGNNSHNRVKIGEMDANHGIVLQNNHKLVFSEYPSSKTGLNIRGDARSVQKLMMDNKVFIFFGINDRPLDIYEIKDTNFPTL